MGLSTNPDQHSNSVIGIILTDRYELIERIGGGGAGTVYRARDTRLDHIRAIKLLHLNEDASPESRNAARQRIRTEARAATRLERNPHVLKVIDVEPDNDPPFLVMEHIQGVDGEEKHRVPHTSRHEPAALGETRAYVRAVCSALNAAHKAGLVHRDVKPSNVMVADDGRILLGDFGIVRVLNNEHNLTGAFNAIGTLRYMAPEQKSNGTLADARADIYSTGATLFFFLTGEHPEDLWRAEKAPELLKDVPENFRPVILKACAVFAEDRYQTIMEFCDAFEEAYPATPVGFPKTHSQLPIFRPSNLAAFQATVVMPPPEESREKVNNGTAKVVLAPTFTLVPSNPGIHSQATVELPSEPTLEQDPPQVAETPPSEDVFAESVATPAKRGWVVPMVVGLAACLAVTLGWSVWPEATVPPSEPAVQAVASEVVPVPKAVEVKAAEEPVVIPASVTVPVVPKVVEATPPLPTVTPSTKVVAKVADKPKVAQAPEAAPVVVETPPVVVGPVLTSSFEGTLASEKIVFTAKISGAVQGARVTLRYRAGNKGPWQSTIMKGKGGGYEATLAVEEALKNGMQYFPELETENGKVFEQKNGVNVDRTNPHTVKS